MSKKKRNPPDEAKYIDLGKKALNKISKEPMARHGLLVHKATEDAVREYQNYEKHIGKRRLGDINLPIGGISNDKKKLLEKTPKSKRSFFMKEKK